MLGEGEEVASTNSAAFSQIPKLTRDSRVLLGFFPATEVNHVMDTLAPSVGGGCGEFWEGALPRGRPPERAGPAAQPFKTS